jgi:phage baseplate assembly protein W
VSTTPVLSVVGVDFVREGRAILDHIDLPSPRAVPAVIRAVGAALARWEQRIDVGEINAARDGAALRLTVSWRPSADGAAAFWSGGGEPPVQTTEVAWA